MKLDSTYDTKMDLIKYIYTKLDIQFIFCSSFRYGLPIYWEISLDFCIYIAILDHSSLYN